MAGIVAKGILAQPTGQHSDARSSVGGGDSDDEEDDEAGNEISDNWKVS